MPVVERIFGLTILHLVIGAAAAGFARIDMGSGIGLNLLPIVPCFALTLCQASLLALWVVSSKIRSRHG